MLDNKYMTRKEVCEYLEITDNYSETGINNLMSRIITSFGLNHTKEKVNGRMTTVYYRDEIIKIANKVLDFFDKHYTKNVAEEKLGVKINYDRFESVPIPDGYIMIMKTSTGCQVDKVAYKKEIIDSQFEVKDKIEQGYYVSRKEAMNLLGISERPFNRIKKELDEISFSKGYYYSKDKIESMLNSQREVTDKIEEGYYISRIEAMELLGISDGKTFNKRKTELDEVLFNNRYYYKKDQVESMLAGKKIKKKTRKVQLGEQIKKNNSEVQSSEVQSNIPSSKPKGFISKKEVFDMLGINYNGGEAKDIQLRQFVDGFNIERVSIFYKESDVIEALKKIRKFRDEYYSKEEMSEILSISYCIDIGKVIVEPHYAMVLKELDDGVKYLWKSAYRKEDIDKYAENLNNYKSKIESGEYISLKESREILNVSVDIMKKMRAEYKLDEFQYGTSLYFNKKQILYYKNECEKFFDKYILSKDAAEKYLTSENVLYEFPEYLNKYDAPLYVYTKSHATSLGQTGGKVFKISEVKSLSDNLENMRREERIKKQELGTASKGSRDGYINHNLEGETYLDTFYLRLYEKWDGFSDKSQYTKNKWLEFAENKINNMRADRKVSNQRVNKFVKCTIELNNLLKLFNVNEVYELTSNNINTYFSMNDNRSQKDTFYDFFGIVSEDVEYVAKKKGSKKRGFRMDLIFSPYNEERKKRKSKPYGFEIYSQLFKYAVDLDLHIKKSIDEIINQNTAIYASTWLYNILHLNNAWRHGDVTRFPRLELQDILTENKINDYSWFKDNKIPLETCRLVITRVIQWEFTISKTKAEGTFFCSDELAPAFASSVLILALYHEKRGHVYNPEQGLNTPLMEFTTTYNQPSEKNINDYYSEIEIEGFKFSSLRMNKTILTLVYYLANLSGDSKALVYAQKIRGQLDSNSPLDYVEIDMKEFDSLTRHLFARGEFGYITSLLVARLQDGSQGAITFENMTEQIVQVNGLFGELNGLYNTVGFLNTIKHERQLIIDTLAEKSLKECQMLLASIFTEKLPSRMKNIQCLISNQDCYMRVNKMGSDEDEVSCFDCPYHIPSIYGLTTLCESLVNDLKKYKTASRIKQFKLSLSIDRKLVLLEEAINRYGEEYVYNCISLDKETFAREVEIVDYPDEFRDLITLEG